MNKVFLDADVILALFVQREPFHLDALRLISQLKRSRTPSFTSPVVAANVATFCFTVYLQNTSSARYGCQVH